jgi:hypothetical protein
LSRFGHNDVRVGVYRWRGLGGFGNTDRHADWLFRLTDALIAQISWNQKGPERGDRE